MDAFVRQDEETGQLGVEILYQRGFRLYTLGQYAEATDFFRAMLHAAPTDERGWLALGDCHERLGQERVALELYSAGSIAAHPAPRCLISRFRALYDVNRPLDAQVAYDEAMQIAVFRGDEVLVSILEEERRTRP